MGSILGSPYFGNYQYILGSTLEVLPYIAGAALSFKPLHLGMVGVDQRQKRAPPSVYARMSPLPFRYNMIALSPFQRTVVYEGPLFKLHVNPFTLILTTTTPLTANSAPPPPFYPWRFPMIGGLQYRPQDTIILAI